MTRKNIYFLIGGFFIGVLTFALLCFYSFTVLDTSPFLLHLEKVISVVKAFLNLIYLDGPIDPIFLKGLERDLALLESYIPLLEELLIHKK